MSSEKEQSCKHFLADSNRKVPVQEPVSNRLLLKDVLQVRNCIETLMQELKTENEFRQFGINFASEKYLYNILLAK